MDWLIKWTTRHFTKEIYFLIANFIAMTFIKKTYEVTINYTHYTIIHYVNWYTINYALYIYNIYIQSFIHGAVCVNILMELYTSGLAVGGGGIYSELTLFVSLVLRLRN